MEIHPEGSSRRKAYEEECPEEGAVALHADPLVKKRCCDLQEGKGILFKFGLKYAKNQILVPSLPRMQ